MANASLGTAISAQSTLPTFAKDVAPILYKNCTSCHRPAGLGPMSLLTYDAVRERAEDIRDAITAGHMPPWHADAPRGKFLNDRRLAEYEKQTIVRWIDAGMPNGDAKDLPPEPTYPTSWTVGVPDVVIAMPTEYDVPAHGVVEYQYFEVPTNFTEDKWVQSIEILPGAREVVHHVLVFARPPSAAPKAPVPAGDSAPPPLLIRREDQGLPEPKPAPDGKKEPEQGLGALIGTTAPGTNVLTFPSGTALHIPAGAVLTFQMHYTTHGHEAKDRTSVGMIFAKAAPDEEMYTDAFVNGMFAIPAGVADYRVPSELGFRENVHVWALFPHTHLRGKRWEYRLVQADGRSEVILSVPNYDFNWQTYYQFANPIAVPVGARIEAVAWYDNSVFNSSNPDPKKEVRWGDQTWDEMQYTGLLYTVDSRRLSSARK